MVSKRQNNSGKARPAALMARCLIGAVATIVLSMAAEAQAQSRAPRLVVGIFVDGLSADAVDILGATIRPDGLSRIVNQGVVMPQVDYSGVRGAAPSTAMLLTGTSPHVNGITSASVYDRDSRRNTSIVYDPAYIGNFTSSTLSPATLRVGSIVDELRLSTPTGTDRVYSIAPDAAQAIVAGSYSANSAVWINDDDGRWATSTYYRDLPEAVKKRNYSSPLSARIDTIVWRPTKIADNTFRYTFPRSNANRYAEFKLTPRAGDETASLACDYITMLAGGTRVYKSASTDTPTDMLLLHLSVAEYPYGSATYSLSSERLSAYQALDRQLAQILSTVSSTFGLDETLIFVAGTPADPYSRPSSSADNRIPVSDFSPRRGRALLNMYLMALHGNGEWVTGYNDLQYYLNLKLAEEQGIAPATLRREAADFLLRMSGVTDAMTIDDIARTPSLSLLYDLSTAGDVVIAITPGWRLVETDEAFASHDGKVIHYTSTVAPFYLLYAPIGHKVVDHTVDARSIAPTLAGVIKIRAPAGAQLPPVSLK